MPDKINKDVSNASSNKQNTKNKKEIKLKEPRIKMSFLESTRLDFAYKSRSTKKNKKEENK